MTTNKNGEFVQEYKKFYKKFFESLADSIDYLAKIHDNYSNQYQKILRLYINKKNIKKKKIILILQIYKNNKKK